MQRVKTATAIAVKPAYTAGGTPGYFRSGDAVAAIPPTVPGPDWFNMVQEEIVNVILAAGLTLNPEDDTQLADAIAAMIAAQAVTVGPASTTEAGIVERATPEEVLAGEDGVRYVSPADMAAAIIGKVRAYTRQQHNAPVSRTGQNGSQAVDMDLHQLLSITATGAIALAAPTNLAVGKTATIMIYSASSVAITYDAAYLASIGCALPSATTAGKWLILNFFCHKAGALLLTGMAEEA